MSSKKFVCLFMVAIVCGLIAGSTAYGQSTASFTIQGTVLNADGTSAGGGLEVEAASFVPFTTRADGTYGITFLDFFGGKISVGDVIEISVKDNGVVVASESYPVTASVLTTENQAVKVENLDITILSVDISVDVAPSAFTADTAGTGTVTVTVDKDGPVTDETVTLRLSPAVGSVTSPATNNGDGTYSATYTSGTTAGRVTLTATATQAGASGTATITINAGPPATIELSAAPETVSSLGSATITAMVKDTGGNGVGGLSPTGTASSGAVSNFAENTANFGMYTATYTAPEVEAEGTDTVTVMVDGLSAELTLNLTPVPPVDVSILIIEGTVFKVDGIVPADGVTTTVTVGANTPQVVTTGADGSYSVTLFNPLGIVASTGDAVSIVVTDDTGAERGREDFRLNNDQLGEGGTATVTQDVVTDIVVPPRSVNVLVVEGVVYAADGVNPLEDVDVTITVTIGANPSQTTTINGDGTYSVTGVDLIGTVASTGDMVSTVVVTDADGAERGRAEIALTNAHLNEDGSGMVQLDVMTDIPLPPKSVNVIVVEGIAYKDDETTHVGPGLDVAITVGSNAAQTTQTATDGSFSTTTLNLLAPVASTGDAVSIVVSDGSGERGRAEFALTNAQLGDTGSTTVTQDVITNIGATSGVLAVTGTVYFKNGDSESVPAASHLREGDLTVVVTNTTRNLTHSGPVDDDGGYDVTFLNLLGIVAETGDHLTLAVQNDAGETVGTMSHTLTTPEVKATRAEVDIHTTVPAQVSVLNVIGSVIELDGSAAGAGLEVTLTIAMNGHTMPPVTTLTDASGGYEHTFVDLLTPVASTGDTLMVDVLRTVDQFHGHTGAIELRSHQLVDQKLVVDPITLIPPRLELGGLSINTHYTGIQDPIIQRLLSMDLAALAAQGASAIGPPAEELLVSLPPSLPLLISPILAAIGAFQLELPEGFDLDDPNIVQESFGNAITTRPTAWAAFPAAERTPGRWINGNQLNLYLSGAPTIDSVTFMLNGSPVSATSVAAGGSFPYTFQLEEELIALFSGAMPTFSAVQLMVDGHSMPVDMTRGDGGVWSADVMLSPGSQVSYYYMVELSQPYHDPMGGITVSSFPFIDPLNRQLRTDGLSAAIEGLLISELGALDPGVRSVFSVPAVDYQQSLWVGKLDLSADGPHQLDVNVTYRGTVYEDTITGKMIYVDRTAPTSGVALNLEAPGHNAGLYMRPDGTYVATGPMPGEASLTVMPTTPLTEAGAYMLQLARLDASGYPGAWNPVVTADLLPLNLETLLTDPASVLPLSLGNPIDMLIRNSEGGGLLGRYGLRAVGIDSLLNMDSGSPVSVVVDLVPPDPDVALITSVQSDFDGNGVIEGLEMQYTSGDVAIYSNSMVELTVYMKERTVHPLASIAIEFQLPGGAWQPIGMYGADQLGSIMQGNELSVNLPVPDFPFLPDRGAHIMVRTVTTNALNVVSEEMFSAAYLRRLPPEISAIHTYVTHRNPDSGGPQGLLTVSAFTQAMTAPDATAVQFEIRRSADTDWMPLGIVQLANTNVTSHVQVGLIEDLVNTIVAGAPTAPIDLLYREWSHTFDSALLEDTILDDTPAASDASLDDNPYVVQAIAVDATATRYESAEGVGDSFSLDNYSPTAITEAANELWTIDPREDGSYHFGGLVHESVPDPMLTLTARTGAHPNAFIGGIKLAVNDASGTAMEIPETAFNRSGDHTYTAVFNLASIPNGMYTFMAVAHAGDGSVEERIVAMAIDVEVGNFIPPENFADPTVDILSVINTQGDAHSPSEIDAQYAAGFPAIGEEVCVTLMVSNVAPSDIDVLIGDDGMSAAAMGALTVMSPDANVLSICIDTSGLDEGMYSLVGVVSKANGSIQFGLPSIRVDRTAPVVEIVSPVERHQVTTLPTIHVTFSDATGFDVTDTDPMHVVISLSRLADEAEIDITETLIRLTSAAAGEILTRSGDIVYTHDDPVIGGAYSIGVSVMDVLGNETVAEPVEFTVEGVQPTVSIVSPIAGRIIDPRQPLVVSVALTGNGDITVTEFQINGNDIEGTLENNWLTYTMQPPLVDGDDSVLQRGSDNTISVKIVDSDDRTAEGSSQFVVSLDDTPPVISGPSPTGDITRKIGRVTATVTDNESNITRIQYALDSEPLKDISFSPSRVVNVGGGKEVKGQTSFNLFDAPVGTHSVTIVAESTGGSTTLTWEFTIVNPDTTPPKVVTYSPLGIIRTDRPVLAATVSDESGFARNGITLILAGVPGNQGSGRRSSPTSTTVTFTPSISVTPGPYTARLTVVDRYNNRTEAEWQFTVELDETPPAVTASSPHGVIRSDKPIISVSASDDMSGVDTIDISVKGEKWNIAGVTTVRSDKTSATFTPTASLESGIYTVDVKLADMAGNKASAQWQFTVELDTIAPSVLMTRPSQEHTENRRPVISASYTDNLSGVDVGSVKLSLNGATAKPDEVSETQVVFTPTYDLPFGQHTVKLEVSDLAPNPNTAVHEWTFYVERIGIADARNYPNPFEDETMIAFRISRQAKITIRVYDFTGRLVATPLSNSVREAGVVEVDWHAQTSAGDHLARGVYFCHILMESELEPQSTILKMAVVSD